MKAKKIFEKFEEDSDPISDMGIGRKAQILKDLKDHSIDPSHVKINSELEIYWVGPNYYKSGNFVELQLKYLSPEKRKFVQNILKLTPTRWGGSLQSKDVQMLEQHIQEALDDKLEKSEINFLLKEFSDHKEVIAKATILLSKLSRTEEEEDYDDMVNIYVFIGYTEKVPIIIKGEQFYKDMLQAESIIKIDKFNTGDLQSIGMMKLRAKIQYGGDGNTYMVHVPKDMMDEDRYDSIPEKHRKFIETHKQKI